MLMPRWDTLYIKSGNYCDVALGMGLDDDSVPLLYHSC
jgi:hypothetical protein